MAEIHPIGEPRHAYIGEGRPSGMRATWHTDSGIVVLSLWHGDVCVGSAHLTPGEAARLSSFITKGLADVAAEAMRIEENRVATYPTDRAIGGRLEPVLAGWRRAVGRLGALLRSRRGG